MLCIEPFSNSKKSHVSRVYLKGSGVILKYRLFKCAQHCTVIVHIFLLKEPSKDYSIRLVALTPLLFVSLTLPLTNSRVGDLD